MSMKQLPTWLAIWLANIVVFYATSLLAGRSVVLGNQNLTPLAAALLSGFLLMLITILTRPTVKLLGIKIKAEEHWAIVYWLTNSVGIWLIARAAIYTGFGISGFWWAIILGLIITLFQWAIWKVFASNSKKKK